MNISEFIEKTTHSIHREELYHGEIIFNSLGCVILSQSAGCIDFIVCADDAEEGDYLECALILERTPEEITNIVPECQGKRIGWDRYSYACLLQYEAELNRLLSREKTEHKRYTREGMIRRVLAERKAKADKANYHIQWADNIYGDHVLTNDTGQKYKIFLRDFENKTGYSNSADARFNKLGTTKHIMYAFRVLKETPGLYNKLSKAFPFIEIYCDPLNDYKISWYYPGELPLEEKRLISRFFKKANFVDIEKIETLLDFITEAEEYDTIRIRPEVKEKIGQHYEQLALNDLSKQEIDFSPIKATLFPYQKEGISFALFKNSVIIADEMGLGKTIQAIGTAILKKQIFGFKKTLVVCPATLKSQWKKEIEKFSDEKAWIVSGMPDERAIQYTSEDYYFFIVNYETVLRDSQAINQAEFDFLILDEAQKIKNYETKTFTAINRLQTYHQLAITGTPIENRLIDLYSIMSVIKPGFFGPLWEFSYQHCEFDPDKPNKINGYYNLNQLNGRLSEVLIRREKSAVLSQLPMVQQFDVICKLSDLQKEFHAGYMQAVAAIIRKKYITPYDLQRLNMALNSARMVCDSTFLIDDTTNESPKLKELEYILFEKLDLTRTRRKIIIFSEWIKVHSLIGDMLKKHSIGFIELNGKVPVKQRSALIRKFEQDDNCQVFLSTEAGGAGLNLQMADMLINFELPWNPAKKNQRIGRIDRLGQKSKKLTIYNLISKGSIEQQIAAGLLVKQNLFDGVLSEGNSINYVDFSTKGRSQFIQMIEEFINQQEQTAKQEEEMVKEEAVEMADSSQLELFEKEMLEEDDLSEEAATSATSQPQQQVQELEQVMNNGMQFLAGLFKMSTGKDLGLENQQIEVDKNTGEVVMRFKLKV